MNEKSGRDRHPGLNSLMEGVTRRDLDKVMGWSSIAVVDYCRIVGELKAKGDEISTCTSNRSTSARPLAKQCYKFLAC